VSPIILAEYESLIGELGFTNLKVVIDVGAGSGLSSIPFIRRGRLSILLDISKEALRLARETMRARFMRNVELVLADAFHLPFRDKCADLIFSWGLLEHFKPVDSVRILREKLRVGRTVMEIVPCRKCIGYRLAKGLAKFLKRKWPYGGEIERDYVEQEIVEELTRAGWQVKRLTGFGRTLGVGFLLSVITNPYSYRKALSKHPTLEKNSNLSLQDAKSPPRLLR
jgi:ubiquinone/menaquinone biosynthesis C-methylase UbiE